MYKASIITKIDLIHGYQRRELWSLLAWNEVKKKYRRSKLGPIWASINTAVFAGVLGTLYSEILGLNLKIYLPHLILGWLIWQFVSQVVLEGCHQFVAMRAYILEISVPITVFIYSLVFKNIILFAFGLLVFLIVAITIPVPLSIRWVYSLVGLLFMVVNAFWMGMLIAVLASRYHDLIEVVGNLFRVLFFVTPVIWMPGMEGRFNTFLVLNPFYHLITVIRSPILGVEVAPISWLVVVAMALIGWLVTIWFYGSYRDRIAFWI